MQLLYENGSTSEQVRGLIFASTQCEYFLHMRCKRVDPGRNYWESYYGRVNRWEKLGGTICQQGSCAWKLVNS